MKHITIKNPNSPALNNIINATLKAGITVVAVANNYGASMITPANNPSVLTVSAIGDSDGVDASLAEVGYSTHHH